MSSIVNPVAHYEQGTRVVEADPAMFKSFWREVKGGYFFRDRRVFLDLLHNEGWKIFYLPDRSVSRPPFILVGKWRDRREIRALWHVKAEGADKRTLVISAARACFNQGTERLITRLLSESEASEFKRWGFEVNCRIILLERKLYMEPPPLVDIDGPKIIPYRKRALHDVLEVDATAFDDFWRLDAQTLEAIASSCIRNTFLLARSGEETLGYAIGGVNGHLGYIQRLGVHDRCQGKGIGENLALGLLHALHHMGATTVMVNTQEDNLSALRLYRSLGFHEISGSRYIMQYTAGGEDRGR